MQFFLLKKPSSGSREDHEGYTDVTKTGETKSGGYPSCPKCGRPVGMREWLPPFQVELESWGRHYGDVARIGDDLIVSDRFTQVFEASGLTGLSNLERVEVVRVIHRRGKLREPLPQYFKAAVVRSRTMIDQEASGYVWEDESKICPECLFDNLKRFERLVVKEDTWCGEDVFFPRGGNGPIVSERFKSAFDTNGLLGASFLPVEEYHYDYFPWEIHPESNP